MPNIGRLGAAALGKETVIGTAVTPTQIVPFIPPLGLSTEIDLLEAKGIYSRPDVYNKAQQGAGLLKSGKIKFEAEPENGLGEHLMASHGTDTLAEVASLVIGTGVNDTLDFNIGAGNLVATVAAGTYKAGQTQADTGTLCQLLYAAIVAAEGAGTYTVSYTRSTNAFTITRSAGTLVLDFDGPNTAKTIMPTIGFTTDQFGGLTYTGTAIIVPFSHTFTRASTATPPSYTLWVNNTTNYPQWAGCMLNKLEISGKAKEFIEINADWSGMAYAAGITHALTYSPRNPFKFNQAVMTIAGSGSTNYEDFKVSVDNMVEVQHVLGSTIYGQKIYSKGYKISGSLSFIVENSTEWAKFIAGTSTTITIAITGTDLVGATAIPYSLTITIPQVQYKAAPWPLPDGLIKINFTWEAIYNVSATNTMSIALVNSKSAAY